jgi:hypothetical protein
MATEQQLRTQFQDDERTNERLSFGYRNNTILVGDRGQFRFWDSDDYVTGYVQDIGISTSGYGASVFVIFRRDGYRQTYNCGYEKFAANFIPEGN